MKKSTWFLVLLFFGVSCLDDPDCFQLNNDLVGISFRVLGSSTADTIAFRSIKTDQGEFIPPAGSSVGKTTFFIYRMNRQSELASFQFDLVNGTKLLDLNYRVQIQFVSEDCGSRFVLSDLEAATTDFDSVSIFNPTPGRDSSSQNMIIYRCPKPDSIEVKLWELSLPATGVSAPKVASALFNSITIDGASIYSNKRTATVRLPANKVGLGEVKSDYVFSIAKDLRNDLKEGTLSLNYLVTESSPYEETCGPIRFVSDIAVNSSFEQTELVANSNGTERTSVTDPILTNLNMYRCPPTNMIQLSFRGEGTEDAATPEITSITADHTTQVLYADTTLRIVTLPLNPASTSTTFTITYPTGTETITFNYAWTDPRSGVFAEGVCSNLQVVTNLSVVPNDDVQIAQTSVLYPAVVNAYVEVPN